jgi:hypothetical protein
MRTVAQSVHHHGSVDVPDRADRAIVDQPLDRRARGHVAKFEVEEVRQAQRFGAVAHRARLGGATPERLVAQHRARARP